MRTRFLLIVGSVSLLAAPVGANGPSFLSMLHHVATLTSTVPANGDVNPYGVAVVPVTTGALVANSVLISNFNNSANLQGTGTTIVQISPTGSLNLFAQIDGTKLPAPCPGGVGLTTAIVALRSGFVIVGSLPTTDGTSATAQAGCLIVLNSSGAPVAVWSGSGINGPWDMTALDMGTAAVLFGVQCAERHCGCQWGCGHTRKRVADYSIHSHGRHASPGIVRHDCQFV